MRYLALGLLLNVLFPPLALAEDARVACPIGESCSVLILTDQEKKILLDERGILATAAQARSLDLGSLAAYFQQKIAKAPAGDAKEPAKPSDPKPATPEH